MEHFLGVTKDFLPQKIHELRKVILENYVTDIMTGYQKKGTGLH